MDWLTRELTAIEKVRRNVVLLAALSALLAFFPVQADQISILGARFTSDVVSFSIFHALVFYTMVLATRAFIHGRIANFERTQFEDDLEKQLDGLTTPQQSRSELLAAISKTEADERDLRAKRDLDRIERLAELNKSHEAWLSRRGELEHQMMEDDLSEHEKSRALEEKARCVSKALQVEQETAQYRALIDAEDRAPCASDQLKLNLAARDFKTKRRSQAIAQQAPFSAFVSTYVIVGEYLFPIAFGVVSAYLLVATQTFPMLWELSLRSQ